MSPIEPGTKRPAPPCRCESPVGVPPRVDPVQALRHLTVTPGPLYLSSPRKPPWRPRHGLWRDRINAEVSPRPAMPQGCPWRQIQALHEDPFALPKISSMDHIVLYLSMSYIYNPACQKLPQSFPQTHPIPRPPCCSKTYSSRHFSKRFRLPESPAAAPPSMTPHLPHWQSCACWKTAKPGATSSKSTAYPTSRA